MRRAKRQSLTPLKLTSMMDILVVLLLFLLKSFVVDAELVTPASGVELPRSSSQDQPEASLVLVIRQNEVLVDGRSLDVVNSGSREFLPGVKQELRGAQDRLEAIQKAGGERDLKVTIQGDKQTPFYVIDSVMFTLQQGGCGDIALAVLQEGSGVQ